MTFELERRKEPRKYFRTAAQVMPARGPVFEARTLDLSPSGMCIVGLANPVPESRCTICFCVPSSSPGSQRVQTSARIVYSIFSSAADGFRIGLEFIDLPAASLSAITVYLAL